VESGILLKALIYAITEKPSFLRDRYHHLSEPYLNIAGCLQAAFFYFLNSTPATSRGESMYRMEKITTGAAYGASAGSILNGMLNAYSPEQWNAIGVLVGIIIAVLTYLTNLYFKIREDNRRNRSRDEPDSQE
jgi:hypothetical protein